uniref:Ig-like domain-containing protein n=1 Tax=Astatotilapia calliptera TaxID=8154 RepID=A0A3P8P808_ASTCA
KATLTADRLTIPAGGISNRTDVTLQPSWSQIFTGETITLRCEIQGGEGKVWKYEWTAPNTNSPPTSSEYRISRVSVSHSGDYRCRGSKWSEPVNLKVLDNDGNGPILVSPVHPVTEGASVSLSCSLRTQKILSNVFFYHNDKLLQNDPRGELKISAVSKSDEGFYKCQYSGRESAQSWMSVKGEQDQNI